MFDDSDQGKICLRSQTGGVRHHLKTMNHEDYKRLISELPFGKELRNAKYLHLDYLAACPRQLQELIEKIRKCADADRVCNVIKFHFFEHKISLLHYPDFFASPHPELQTSVTVDLANGKVRRHDYLRSANPPILHRKETMLPPEHPLAEEFHRLTQAEEAEGLFENPHVIGFKLNWESLLAAKGLAYTGHELVRTKTPAAVVEEDSAIAVQRHKTAIARYRFSKPIQNLLEYGLLDGDATLLDYGCGQGDDVKGLNEMGYQASGWDPVFSPRQPKEPAAIVNLGFVLNVIEDPVERSEVLQEGYQLSRRLLVVAVLMANCGAPIQGRPYKDGILTSRNTFQKYFQQHELQQYLEDVLSTSAVAVAPGIFYVFRSHADQQRFLAGRSKRSINWEEISRRLFSARERPKKPRKEALYEKLGELLDAFWGRMLELGRVPTPQEFDQSEALRSAVGSANRARKLFIQKFGEETLGKAFEQRRNDLLVYLALSNFRRRVPFRHLPAELKTDIKTFLGGYKQGIEEGQQLLFAAGNPDLIESLCNATPIGWLDPQALYLHRSLAPELHPILRIYVGCAELLYGDLQQVHVIKLHKRSGKVTLLIYDDFEHQPLPALQTRVKVNLRTQTIDLFDHQALSQQQLLYFKERYVASDHPRRAEWQLVSDKLRSLGLDESMGFGPSKDELLEILLQAGLEAADFIPEMHSAATG